MKDLIEAVTIILKQNFGIDISPQLVPYIIVAAAIGPWFLWGYFSVRRWRGDFRAISGELEAATLVISQDTKKEFDAVLRKFTNLHEGMQGAVVQRLDSLHSLIKSTNQISSPAEDTEIQAGPPAQEQSNRVRLNAAESVRDTVLQKWLGGRTFRKSDNDANCFSFEGRSEAGSEIRIILQTPYRASLGLDGRMPFTLEIWANRLKKLNFEWDMDGNYSLRGFRKGDWIEDVAEWHFGPASDQVAPEIAAA